MKSADGVLFLTTKQQHKCLQANGSQLRIGLNPLNLGSDSDKAARHCKTSPA
jgi:hypothetical protein